MIAIILIITVTTSLLSLIISLKSRDGWSALAGGTILLISLWLLRALMQSVGIL